MLTTDRPLRGFRGPATALVAAATMLVATASTVAAVDQGSPDLDVANVGTTEQASLAELRDQLDELASENSLLVSENSLLVDENLALTDDNLNLTQTVEDVERERDKLQDSLAHFDDLYAPLEADRQLLVELRKGLPETRVEAEAQLDRIERLALSSNPARLGQLVDRMSDTAPAFLDWRFTEFDSTQAASEAYINTGANAFDSSMDEFRDAVLLSVANRLDGLLNVLDRVR